MPNIPFPLRSGGHIRDWNILLFLNQSGIKPHIVYFKAGEKYSFNDDSPLCEKCSSVHFACERLEITDKTITQKLKRKLSYLFPLGNEGFSFFNIEPVLYPFSYQYDAINAGDKILKYALKVKAEIVILRAFLCHNISMFQKEGIKVIANCPDYNTHLAQEMIKTQKNPLKKIGPWLNYLGVKKQEMKYLQLCDEIWVPTQKEIDLMSSFIRKDKLKLFPNLIDVESYPDYSDEETEPGSLLFVGNYDYTPNLNAANLLIEKIFPAVKKEISYAKLYLVGKGLPKDLLNRISKDPSIIAPGFVENVLPYFKKASIFVCPVYEGAGMLLKVVEALAMGKIVIGFKESFRGINCSIEHQNYLTANNLVQFVFSIIEILIDKNKRMNYQSRARQFAIKELSIKSLFFIFNKSIVT